MDIVCGFLRDYVPPKGREDSVLRSHVDNCRDCRSEAGLA